MLVLIQAAIVAAVFGVISLFSEPAEARPRNPIAELAPWPDDVDEDPGERMARLDLIRAEALAVAESPDGDGWRGDRRELAALVLAIGWHETRFARVAPDDCPIRGGCDRGKAWHYYQTHTPRQEREDGWPGLSKATRDAVVAVRRGAGYCGGSGMARLVGAVSVYATGRSCSWSGAAQRVRLAKWIERRL